MPLVPEVTVRATTDLVALWERAEAAGLPGRSDAPRVQAPHADADADTDADRLAPPFWAVPWAGGQALARHVLDHPALVRGLTVLDLACGSGLVAIAAARAGAAAVTAVDVDPGALVAAAVNAGENGVAVTTTSADVRDSATLPAADVVLAGDVCYDRDVTAAMLPALRGLAARGVVVLVGDPRRRYLPREGVEPLAEYDVPVPLDLEGMPVRRTVVVRVLP